MAYNKKYAELGESVIDYVNDREDAIDQGFEQTTTQLAQTADTMINKANAGYVLPILNPYGTYENIHPKVLHFENGWNGFKYWMAYTPYTNGRVEEENPCIAVSNDMVNWGVPAGLVNPLSPYPGVRTHYNNDTHLLYRADTDTMEIWWRVADSVAKTSTIKRRTTTDGVNWTSEDIVIVGDLQNDDYLSPAVMFEDGLYKFWSVENGSVNEIRYCESPTGNVGTWTSRQRLSFDVSEIENPWHIDVIHTDLGYEFIIQNRTTEKGNNFSNLYHMIGDSNNNFTKPKLIMKPSINGFDNQGLYRSSLLKIDGIYYLYYTGISKDNKRGISLAFGKNITGLTGLDVSNKFAQSGKFLEVKGEHINDRGSFELDSLRFFKPGINGVRATVKNNNSHRNVLQIISDTNTSELGSLESRFVYLEDSAATPAYEGGLTYSKSTSRSRDGVSLSLYDGSKYHYFAEKFLNDFVYARRTSGLTLSNGTEFLVPFQTRVKDAPNKWRNGNNYTAITSGWFDIDVNFVINGISSDNSFKVYLKKNEVELENVYESNGNGGVQTVIGRNFVELEVGDTLSVAIVFSGSGSPTIVTNKGYIKIEKKYNPIA